MNNHLHPVMQQALAPFLPRPVAGFARPPLPTPPKPSSGMFVYEWDTDCSVPVVCHLEYERAQRETQIDPSIPSSMRLEAAYVHDVDIFYLLDAKQIARIEELALEEYERE